MSPVTKWYRPPPLKKWSIHFPNDPNHLARFNCIFFLSCIHTLSFSYHARNFLKKKFLNVVLWRDFLPPRLFPWWNIPSYEVARNSPPLSEKNIMPLFLQLCADATRQTKKRLLSKASQVVMGRAGKSRARAGPGWEKSLRAAGLSGQAQNSL